MFGNVRSHNLVNVRSHNVGRPHINGQMVDWCLDVTRGYGGTSFLPSCHGLVWLVEITSTSWQSGDANRGRSRDKRQFMQVNRSMVTDCVHVSKHKFLKARELHACTVHRLQSTKQDHEFDVDLFSKVQATQPTGV